MSQAGIIAQVAAGPGLSIVSRFFPDQPPSKAKLGRYTAAFAALPSTARFLFVLPGGSMDSINTRIAEELSALPSGRVQPQVAAAVALLDEGSTVPFIARYRKEVTGSSTIPSCAPEERLRYLRELEERRGDPRQASRNRR